jgi:hypothetical protein
MGDPEQPREVTCTRCGSTAAPSRDSPYHQTGLWPGRVCDLCFRQLTWLATRSPG